MLYYKRLEIKKNKKNPTNNRLIVKTNRAIRSRG